jgi:hypothetical protein
VTPGEVFPWIEGAGGALVVLAYGVWLFIRRKIVPASVMDAAIAERDKQIAFWQQAHAAERQRADAAVLAAQTTNTVLAALHAKAGGT